MQPHIRSAVAAMALAHALGRKVDSIYSYSESEYRLITVTVSGNRVDGYDYAASCFFDGNIPDLYHYGQNAHIEFKALGNGRYEGYDYGSSAHYEVKVTGQNAEIYDYGVSGYFDYSL